MNITVNDKNLKITEKQFTVLDVLKNENIINIDSIAVQYNGEFLDKNLYASTIISENDKIDYLFFVGGGTK